MNEPCVLVSFERYKQIGRICPECISGLMFAPVSLHVYLCYAPASTQGGTIIHKGTPLPVFSEKDVFKALDIPYAEPKDRDL